MGMAWMWASMSKDPSTQVGAIIVGADNSPLGEGYNGPPASIDDKEIDWSRPNKYPFVRHAERNAISHSIGSVKGATLFVTGSPCPDCMLEIVTKGISKVVYHQHKPDRSSMLSRQDEWEDTTRIAELGRCRLEAYKGNINWLRDWTSSMYARGIFD